MGTKNSQPSKSSSAQLMSQYDQLDALHADLDKRREEQNALGIQKGRSSISFENLGRFHIPKEMVPPGYVWKWARETVQGKPKIADIQMNYQKGWRPISSDRYPELASPFSMGTTGNEKVRRGGMVLMEREEHINSEEKEHYQGLSSGMFDRNQMEVANELGTLQGRGMTLTDYSHREKFAAR